MILGNDIDLAKAEATITNSIKPFLEESPSSNWSLNLSKSKANGFMTLQVGWENDDFMRNKHTILCKEGNLSITFKVDDNTNINQDLYSRLIWHKAFKRMRIAITAYPLGGNIKYYF